MLLIITRVSCVERHSSMVYHHENEVVHFWQRTELYHSQCTILGGTQANVFTTLNINSDYLVLPIITT